MFEESITDIRVAFKVYFTYKKQFILTYFLFLAGIILSVFTIMVIYLFLIRKNVFDFDETILFVLSLIILLLAITILFLLLSYARTVFGLTNDIMTSGELFTEFRRTITYFKKYWFYFALLTFPYALFIVSEQIFSMFYLLGIIDQQGGSRILLVIIKGIVFIIDLTLYITLIETFPSLIETRSLKRSFKENFTVLKQDTSRLLISITFYYLIFRGPMFIADVVRVLASTDASSFFLFNEFFLIVTFVNVLVGFPVLSVVSTRIYNTTILKSVEELKT